MEQRCVRRVRDRSTAVGATLHCTASTGPTGLTVLSLGSKGNAQRHVDDAHSTAALRLDARRRQRRAANGGGPDR